MATRNYRVGNFTEMVLFLKPEIQISGTGASETVYVETARRLSEIQDNISAISDSVLAETMEQSYSVITWKVEGVTTEWRAEYNGDRYFIVRILKEERGISRYELKREDLCNE